MDINNSAVSVCSPWQFSVCNEPSLMLMLVFALSTVTERLGGEGDIERNNMIQRWCRCERQMKNSAVLKRQKINPLFSKNSRKKQYQNYFPQPFTPSPSYDTTEEHQIHPVRFVVLIYLHSFPPSGDTLHSERKWGTSLQKDPLIYLMTWHFYWSHSFWRR